MPKIEEILNHEQERNIYDLVLFLEGKFWKAYEQSAYVLTRLYGFKPTKRYIVRLSLRKNGGGRRLIEEMENIL